jgi:amidohydrolase
MLRASLDAEVRAIESDLIELRRQLHRCPELGFAEHQTADLVARHLRDSGLSVQTGVAGTGVIGLLHGDNQGPTFAIRACLDALPVEEQSGVDYPSETAGVMHACGHDGNLVMALGAARILAGQRSQIWGNIKWIFQPAEEQTGGAAAMIDHGCLENPVVDAIVTLHNWHGYPQGLIVASAGAILAACDLFELAVIGKAGHSAWPELAVDPIPVAAEVVAALQRIVSREIDSTRPSLLSIGSIHGGSALNVIPDRVVIGGTVRTLDPAARDFIQRRIGEIASGVTAAARASYDLRYDRVMPPVINDPQLCGLSARAVQAAIGPQGVSDAGHPSMGCEEFSLFQERVPGAFLMIGNDRAGHPAVPIHAPNYIFNDRIIAPGVTALCAVALEYCGCGGDNEDQALARSKTSNGGA